MLTRLALRLSVLSRYTDGTSLEPLSDKHVPGINQVLETVQASATQHVVAVATHARPHHPL